MDPGIAFALGLLGSLHCAAMCGPLMLVLPAWPAGQAHFLAHRIVYQVGRVATYCLLGVMAGLIGKSLFLLGLQRWLSILLGVLILVGYFASNRFFSTSTITRPIMGLKSMMSAQMKKRSLPSQVLLGMLNGLLPCGLVYVTLAGAAAQGTILHAISYMAMFGLGTCPAMLGISLSGKLFPLPVRLRLSRALPIGVCLMAGLLILRGMALGIPYLSPNLASGEPACCAVR